MSSFVYGIKMKEPNEIITHLSESNRRLHEEVDKLEGAVSIWRRVTQISGLMNLVFVVGMVVVIFYPIIECMR